MSAASNPITLEENSQFDYYITKFADECTEEDITGYGAKFQIREEKSATSTVLYEATVGNGITVQPGSAAGLFHIQLTVTAVNSPQKAWTKGWYDFVCWPPGGSIVDGAKRLVEGRAVWSPAVTHP